MMKAKQKMRWKTRYLMMAGMIMLPVMTVAAQNSPAIKALLDQAAYWHEKTHSDLANEALHKVLEVEPNNVDALYLLALYAQQNNDSAAAQSWRQKLAALSPGDSRLDDLDKARALTSIPPRNWPEPDNWRSRAISPALSIAIALCLKGISRLIVWRSNIIRRWPVFPLRALRPSAVCSAGWPRIPTTDRPSSRWRVF
ncbi:hypothetical protein HC231_17255 [Brenneria izadpanahii]|uniref:Cellulose synthase operon protein C n=1 Tax=Brenneria izadpanahii TaxID=2722756 RepID=A0ABX7UUI9_9GAMM|nr:hypothetical protein HC231_17255 [Brenneria izadpanahii]